MTTISAFTKPWKTQSIEEIGTLLRQLGFNGVEYCLREGYQVEPTDAFSGLERIRTMMRRYDIDLTSIAGPLEEQTFEACAHSKVSFIRTLIPLKFENGFEYAHEAGNRFIESILPLAERYKVVVGIQLHTNSLVSSSSELYRFVKRYDSPYLRAIWDSAHSVLAGEDLRRSLNLLHPFLCSINLKNIAYFRSDEGSDIAQWEARFVCGRQGIASWSTIVSTLKEMDYQGNLTITHEYADQQHLTDQLADDRKFLQSLW